MHAFVLPVSRRQFLALAGAFTGAHFCPAVGSESSELAPQPYFAGLNRALEALAKLGAPIAAADAQQITALANQNDSAAVDAAEKILDRYTLARLSLDAAGTGRVEMGGAQRTLVEQGWRMFLVRIGNPGRRTDSLNFASESQGPGSMMSWTMAPRAHMGDRLNKGPIIEKLWVMSRIHQPGAVPPGDQDDKPIQLSGMPVEYRIIELFSRDSGHHSDRFTMYAFTKDSGWPYASGHREFEFDCLPSRTVRLAVCD